jgi:hypothetical protein
MDTTLVAAWQELCQQLEQTFTQPTYITFLQIVTAWVLCRSKPTVTNLVRTIGPKLLGHAAKHWTTYERFFYRAIWDLQVLSQLLLLNVVVPVVKACGLPLVIDWCFDDTTCGRYGKHVAYARYFKDASASNAKAKVVHWAHNWVIGVVMLRPKRWPNWVLGLPVCFTLYRKRPDCDKQHPFRSRQQIVADRIRWTRNLLPDWLLRIATDGQYATRIVVQAAREVGSNLVSRIRSDAALYELPPKRRPRGRRGPHPKKGKRLPKPRQMAARRKKGWHPVQARMYGKVQTRLVLSIVCLWPRVSGLTPIQLLIVRDPAGKEKDDYLFCTDATVQEVEILERFAGRWPVEEAIEDGKQLDGMEKVQGWSAQTVLRQAPLALVVQTLVKAWYLLYGVKAKAMQPKATDWQGSKEHPSYLDMQATLRTALWRPRIIGNSPLTGRVRRLWKTLRFALTAAA